MPHDQPLRIVDPIVIRVPWDERYAFVRRIVSELREHPFADGWFPTNVEIKARGYRSLSVHSDPNFAHIIVNYRHMPFAVRPKRVSGLIAQAGVQPSGTEAEAGQPREDPFTSPEFRSYAEDLKAWSKPSLLQRLRNLLPF